MTSYSSKYSARGTTHLTKYTKGTPSAFGFAIFGTSTFGVPRTSYGSKYSARSTTHTGKYSSPSTVYSGKYSARSTAHTAKYT